MIYERKKRLHKLVCLCSPCSPTETRTQSNRTKIWCAIITPWGYHNTKLRALEHMDDIITEFLTSIDHIHVQDTALVSIIAGLYVADILVAVITVTTTAFLAMIAL